MDAIHSPQSHCRVGIAVGDITPPIGIYHRMWGAARHDRATGVHRPLRGTAAVFQAADRPAAIDTEQVLVALDHCLLGARELDQIVRAIIARADLQAEQIAVVCSHTHAAGLPGLDRVGLPGGELIPEYLASLAGTISALVAEARAEVRPATIVYGTGRCDLAANRDYWDEERGRFVCGFNPLAAADDTLLVARVTGEDGHVLATAVNYACHPTTLAWDNTRISPDYPGAMRELVEEATGAPCLFLQGASGELGPREGFVGDAELADRNGRQLGHAALSALTALPPSQSRLVYTGPVESGATIGTWAHQRLDERRSRRLMAWSIRRGAVALPYRTDLEPIDRIQAELEHLDIAEAEARQEGDDAAARDHRTMAERRRRALARRRALPAGDAFPWQVALWRIGDAIWICVQGEPYSLLQTELRRRFPGTPIIVASVGFSWSVGYLPPADCYGKGIYQEQIAVVAPGSLEQAIDAVAVRIEHCLADSEVPS